VSLSALVCLLRNLLDNELYALRIRISVLIQEETRAMKNLVNPTGMLLAACALLISAFNSSVYAQTNSGVPRPDHVVIVVEENHSYSEIINSSSAPYINSLAEQGRSSPSLLPSSTRASPTTSTSSPAPTKGLQQMTARSHYPPQPGSRVDRRRAQLRRLFGRPAVSRLHRLQLSELHAQA